MWVLLAFVAGAVIGSLPVVRVRKLLRRAESFCPPHADVSVKDVRDAPTGTCKDEGSRW